MLQLYLKYLFDEGDLKLGVFLMNASSLRKQSKNKTREKNFSRFQREAGIVLIVKNDKGKKQICESKLLEGTDARERRIK